MTEDTWQLRPLAVGDCDELGRVHMAVWREAYAGLMPANYLAGLSDERCADNWRELAASAESGADEARTLVVVGPDGDLAGFGSAGPSRDEDAPTRGSCMPSTWHRAPAAPVSPTGSSTISSEPGPRRCGWSRATPVPGRSTGVGVSSTKEAGTCTRRRGHPRSG